MVEAAPVGLIGVGLLGGAVAARLLAAGFQVLGFDVHSERRRDLEAMGGIPAASSRDVARGSRRVVLSLPDTHVVETVLAEIEADLIDGQIIIDTTTGDPERVEVNGRRLAERGVAYLDATVLGSSEQVRRGAAIVMAGGPRETFDACADLFGSFARQSFHLGPCGAGSRMKLVVNLVLGLNRAVLAEGLTFARKLGVDPAIALDVLRAGAAYSRVMDAKGPKMLAADFAPQARMRQHLKDVQLILEAATKHEARVPLSELHRALLERLVEEGFGDEDNAAIVRAF